MEGIHDYFIKDNDVCEINKLKYNKDDEIIYEVIRIIQGTPLFLEDHFNRMIETFKSKGVNDELMTLKEMRSKIEQLAKVNKIKEGNVKIIYPIKEGSFYYFFIKHSYPTKDMYDLGVKGIFYFAERKNPKDKVVNTSLREAVNSALKEKEAYEALLVDRNGSITEGSRSNVFMIKGKKLLTPPIKDVLPGVTRKHIIDLAKEEGISVVEGEIKYTDLNKVDSVFISGTSPKILPYKEIENIRFEVSNGVLRKLIEKFDEKIINYIEKNK